MNIYTIDSIFQSFINCRDNDNKLIILKDYANRTEWDYSDLLDAILKRLESFDSKMENAKLMFPLSVKNFINEATYYGNLEANVRISTDWEYLYSLGEHEANKNLINSEIINDYRKKSDNLKQNLSKKNGKQSQPKEDSTKEGEYIGFIVSEIKKIAERNVLIGDINLFMEHGHGSKKIKINKNVTANKIIDLIVPLIDKNIYPQVNDGSARIDKVNFIIDNFEGFAKKTLQNAITEYYQIK
jgi:hypothetical protein